MAFSRARYGEAAGVPVQEAPQCTAVDSQTQNVFNIPRDEVLNKKIKKMNINKINIDQIQHVHNSKIL